jgi:hypothetical protein
LDDVEAAFLRRRRANRYRDKSFRVSREVDPDGWTRVNVDAHDKRLSVWSDGALWFQLAVAGPKRTGGWAYLLSFHGSVVGIDPCDLVVWFEHSYVTSVADPDLTSRLLKIWASVQPVVERTAG